MEMWDLYKRDGSRTDIKYDRHCCFEIPNGLYHLSCEVLVRHTDGDYLIMQRSYDKKDYPGYYEASAGGAALSGETPVECIKRELFEETGIISDNFEKIAFNIFDDDKCLFYSYIAVTNILKDNIVLQAGETISYKWLNKKDFTDFINSENSISRQVKRYKSYFIKNDIYIEV